MSNLQIRGVTKRYGTVTALAGIDLDIPAGSRTAIVGPSGSGKTSLLRIIAGFEFPDAGSVTNDGNLLADGPLIVPAHQRRIGYVPQDGALFPHLNIEDNIGFGLSLPAAERATRVRELMALVSLDTSMLKRWPHELSGGQQQRVALARAMAQRPSLMLLDEPFSALDTALRASTRRAVAQLLSDAGITTILVTHDQAEALSFAEQLVILQEGRLLQVGAPTDIYWRPKTEETARFLGEVIVLPAATRDGIAECALGSIQVDSQEQRSDASVMLRPEQLRLSSEDTAGEECEHCTGVVVEVDFGGHTCVVTVQPIATLDDAYGSEPLQVTCPGFDVPDVGARVRIEVLGKAHLLP